MLQQVSILVSGGFGNPVICVTVGGRPTEVPGLFITPEFEGFTSDGQPILQKQKYRLGTKDGYAVWHGRRLQEAVQVIQAFGELKLDFRRGQRRKLHSRLLRFRDHPTVKKYLTLYSLG